MRLSQAAAQRNQEGAEQALAAANAKLLEVGHRVEVMRSERDSARAETSTIRSELASLHASYLEQIEKIRTDARRDLEAERERTEREGERLQNAITLALQHATELSDKGVASGQQEPPTKTRRARKTKPDGEVSGKGSGGPAH